MQKNLFLCGFFLGLLLLFPASSPCADATTFDPLPIAVQTDSSGGVPVGTIIAWPYSSSPPADQWLECDGRAVPASSALAKMGISNTPDYRGMFLRGVGGKSAALGVAQGDATRRVTGNWHGFTPNLGSENNGAMHGDPLFVGIYLAGTPSVLGPIPKNWDFDNSRQVPTDTEIRPVNKAVRYMIKIN